MNLVSAALSAALVASVASDALAIERWKIMQDAHDITFGVQKDKQYTTQGRYFSPTEAVALENFSLTALGAGAAEVDDVPGASTINQAYRVDFDARDIASGAIRRDSFDLAVTLFGQLDELGSSALYDGMGSITPNDFTISGTPLYDSFGGPRTASIFVKFTPDIKGDATDDSVTATFINTILMGGPSAMLHIAPAFGGQSQSVSFDGSSTWTKVPAPGGLALLAGALVPLTRRRRALPA